MTLSSVSVIVVSRDRPDHLRLCLRALSLQDHPRFEVIVVADPQSIAVVEAEAIKCVPFDEANISRARNAGLAVAAADIVAFIDDDAVAEPTWLSRLTAPLANPHISVTGGFVRARDGISLQWGAAAANTFGERLPLSVDAAEVSLHKGRPGYAIRTEGTNCAFRRQVLAEIGGFDPVFRFYLDETDVNMRLAAQGHVTAIVPNATVQHGFAASARRAPDRAPRDLRDIGASTIAFMRKHTQADDPIAGPISRLISEQRARLIRHMVSGGLEPRDVGRLMATLMAGIVDGGMIEISPLPAITSNAAFSKFPAGPRSGLLLAGRIWQAGALRKKAVQAAGEGKIVTLLLFSPTARPHRMQFHPDGYWEQRGGLFGRSDATDPRAQLWSFSARLQHEIQRISADRPTGLTSSKAAID